MELLLAAKKHCQICLYITGASKPQTIANFSHKIEMNAQLHI